MRFTETSLAGAFVVEPEPIEDERGWFARTFCTREFRERGLEPRLEQCNVSWNRRRGTLRGMHLQIAPHEEVKLVRCTAGAVHDVIVDLRLGSPTYRRWLGVELSARNRRMLYIPAGLAHGFVTLEDETELSYQMSAAYQPAAARGVRFDDPALGIAWPVPIEIVSDKDRSYPDLTASLEAELGATPGRREDGKGPLKGGTT